MLHVAAIRSLTVPNPLPCCVYVMFLCVCVCVFGARVCVCFCVRLHRTEIFQCFLSARDAVHSRERDRPSSGGTGLGSCPGSRGGEEETPGSQEERRGSAGLPEGQDLYTAACNSVIHRCALLLLGVSPVLGDLSRQNQEEEQVQSAGGGAQEGLGFMTRSAPEHT